MNILHYEDILESVRPIVSYGFEVDSLVEAIGFVPIPATEKTVMLDRLNAPGIVRAFGDPAGADIGGLSPGAIVGILMAAACCLCLIGMIYVKRRYKEYQEDSVHDYEGSLHGFRGARSVASKQSHSHSHSASGTSQDPYNGAGALSPIQEQPPLDYNRRVQTVIIPPVRQHQANRRDSHSMGVIPPMQGQPWNNRMNHGGIVPMQDQNWNNAMAVYRNA
jgi:hypothetical protein